MDSFNYYSKKVVSLKNIEEIAINNNYEYSYYADPSDGWLNVKLGETWNDYMVWNTYSGDDFPDDEILERRGQLNTISDLVFLYHQAVLPMAVPFLRLVLENYGGFLDCDGDALELYNLENLEAIIDNCPCSDC